MMFLRVMKCRSWILAVAVSAVLAGSEVSGQTARPGTEWYRDDPATAGAPAAAPAQPFANQADLPTIPPPVAPQPVAPMPAPAVGVRPAVATAPALPGPVDPARRPYMMPPVGQPYGGYGSTNGLYPSYEMNNYATASARAAMARALFRQAESELGNAYRNAQRQFEQSVEYRQALKDERDAWESLNVARTRAISSISDDTKYKRLQTLRDDLAQQLELNRARKSLSQDEIVALASLKMSYSTEIRAMEVTAMANDNSVNEARKRLVDAGAKVSALRLGYENAVRESQDILIARRNLEDARVARLTAEAYLRAATVNSAYAMDYAYYLYRRPSPYGSYADYYGFGGVR